MNVVFDYQTFSEHEYGGVSRYFCALAAELARRPDVHPRVLSPLFVNQYLRRVSPDVLSGRYVRPRRGTQRLILSASKVLFRSAAGRFQPDIVHETYYKESPTSRGPCQRVLTVFDMIHERCPDTFKPGDRTPAIKAAAVARADHIFCISEHTKRDLMAVLGVPEHRITVTPLAADPLPEPSRSASEIIGSEPYLLHVGGRPGYKNFAGILRAYAASAWLKREFRLVCFGGGSLTDVERTLMADLDIPETTVIQLAGSDEVLAALYRGAAAFVYPSRYEGFGIPPLEAMSQGCPVICSNAASIPEVVGDAGVYFAPTDIDSLRTALEHTLQSADERKALVVAGRKRLLLFSWARCASITLSAYRKLLQ